MANVGHGLDCAAELVLGLVGSKARSWYEIGGDIASWWGSRWFRLVNSVS